MTWILATITVLVIGIASVREPPELDEASVWTSASVRNPKQETRVVDGDTLRNPFDHELAGGVQDQTGPVRGSGAIVIERENAERYFGYKSEVVGTWRGIESGWSLADLEDDNVFAHRLWLSKMLFDGVVGIGVTRQWFERWTENGAWMVRASVAHDGFEIAGATIGVTGSYEQGLGRQRIALRAAVKNWSFGSHGQYAVEPFARVQQIDDGTAVQRDYQAKVMLTWTPGKGE